MASLTPTIAELREHFPEESRRRSYIMGVGLYLLSAMALAAGFATTVLCGNIWLKLVGTVISGLSISMLFILGHDACHSILTPSAKLNEVLSRLCFLPAYNPVTTWELGHNRLHHGWTNLKGMDYAYTPFSLEEYRALPWWRRGLERIYRTLPGIALFYMFDVWGKHLIFPRREEWPKLHKGRFAFDLGLVVLFLAAEILFAGWLGWHQNGKAGAVVNVALAIVVPHLMWIWIMGFATVQQHTHPRVAWFDSKEEWTFFFGQVEGTVHVRMPRFLELFFHNVFDHTAHHVDPKIPLYNIHDAQQRLKLAYAGHVTTVYTTPRELCATLRACKLYDYRRHCWTDFEGNPTADPILVPKSPLPTEMTNPMAEGIAV